MNSYTAIVQRPLESISLEDEDFIEELMAVAALFRSFSEAMDQFLPQHGYTGDITDIEAKTAFLRRTFEEAGMQPPREIREWFRGQQPISRETAFQICFAFGLDGSQTDEFFRRVYMRERSFNCHRMREAVYYFCLNNQLSFADAENILKQIPENTSCERYADAVFTGSIIRELNQMDTPQELVDYLKKNAALFVEDNVTAYTSIKRLWEMAAGPDGLLLREMSELPSMLDDLATGRSAAVRAKQSGIRNWDAFLAIFQMDKKSVSQLNTDRTIRPILACLHADVRDSFPDRQGIDRILRGERVSYERVRKWLVLLLFYVFWAKKALESGNYAAHTGDAERCISRMNQHLIDCGYPEMYVGNPYDWIFFYAAKNDEPLNVFRYIFNELLTRTLEKHS